MKGTKRVWWGLVLLMLFSPIGLISSEAFKSGLAWKEGGLEEVTKMLRFIPEGSKEAAHLWSAPLPDHNLKSWKDKGLVKFSQGYIFSAGIDLGIILLVNFLLGKVVSKEKEGWIVDHHRDHPKTMPKRSERARAIFAASSRSLHVYYGMIGSSGSKVQNIATFSLSPAEKA